MADRIRRATAGDLDAVAALESACFGDRAWSSALLTPALADALVLENAASDVILGFAVVRVAGDQTDLDRIAVHPSRHGCGLGRHLLNAVIAEAACAGAEAIMLEVASDNEPALRLYRSSGFTAISRRRGYYPPENDGTISGASALGNTGVDAIVMHRWLAAEAHRASVEI